MTGRYFSYFRKRLGAFMRLSIVSICGLILGAGCISNAGKSDGFAGNEDSFSLVQQAYFPMLNFRSSADRVKAIPGFSGKLSALADGERLKLGQGQLNTPSEQARAGLIFIYDGLMHLNNIGGVSNGVFKIGDLVAVRRFHSGRSQDDKDEEVARYNYVINEFTTAAKLRPDDQRIDSWLASAKRGLDELKNGGASAQQSMSTVLDAISARPTFNLWTAILVFKNEPAISPLFDRLTNRAKSFVDGLSNGHDPCTQRPQDCGNGVHAPFNAQAAITVLGDVFLRRSEEFLNQGDIPRGMKMLGYADGTYRQLTSPKNSATTKKWPDNVAVDSRREWVSQLMYSHITNGKSITQTNSYSRVYECSSCHGR